MTVIADPEILSFAQRLLEKKGGIAEDQDGLILSLLPADLARWLGVPEEFTLGGDGGPLLYGSPLLDRMILLSTQEFPIAYGQVEVSYLKKAGFEQVIGRDLSFPEAKVRLSGRGEGRTNYMVLTCHFVALSDERKESLIQLGIYERNGALVPGFPEKLSGFHVEYLEPGSVPPQFSPDMELAVSRAMKSAQAIVKQQVAEFLESMRRRLRRDVTNTWEYFLDLRKEMIRSLESFHLGIARREERKAKIEALPREMGAKIEDLKHKYQVKVEVTACAALRLLVPAVLMNLDVLFRKHRVGVQIVWNPITQQIDPLVCESCGQTIRTVFLGEKGPKIFLLCGSCGG